ncbi:MAG: ribbon-helix-helix protein, CopG family [Mesorhizobium sp.]|jgi:predicted transcriptional regulator
MTASTTTTTISIRISSDLKDKLDRLAKGTQRSNSFLAARAIETYVDRELEIVEGILRGIEDVKAGRVVPHEEVMAEARRMIGEVEKQRKKTARG